MKTKIKKKKKTAVRHKDARIPVGMQETYEISTSRLPKETTTKVYSPLETGSPDADNRPDTGNPQAVQGGMGPTNQEGEGERQNSQLAELEQIEPDI